MSEKNRRHFSAEDKATIVRRHLEKKVSVSELCEEYKIQPSVFYSWQKQVFDRAAQAFESEGNKRPSHEKKYKDKIAELERKLTKKDAIIAEISGEYVQLKKELGEP